MRDYILLYINGQPYRVRGTEAFIALSSFLRYGQGATGTKVVCEEGDCGACTVLIGRIENGEITYKPINSCIQFMYQLDLSHVITVEGLKTEGELNAVQESMVKNHGAQCGYCTPGFIVAMCSLFDTQAKPGPQEIKDALTGNLCRCTGYEPIIKAGLEVDSAKVLKLTKLYPSKAMTDDFDKHKSVSIVIEADGKTFFNPIDIGEAVKFKNEHRNTTIVQGGTDICVQCNKRGFDPPVIMSLSNVPSMSELTVKDGVLIIGGKVSLQTIENYIADIVPAFYEILKVFGSPQIKNTGTLAGNICNASPIADSLPFLFVMDAEVELTGIKGQRTVKIRQLYKGYKQLDMTPDEIISQIRVPLPAAHEVLKLYKVSKRKHLDISTFTAALRMTESAGKIESIHISYGGVGPVVLMLPETQKFLVGKNFSLETFELAAQVAIKEITPISDVRGSSTFRNQLATTILEKFYWETLNDRGAHASSR